MILPMMTPKTYGNLALNGIHFFQIYTAGGCSYGSTQPFFIIFHSNNRARCRVLFECIFYVENVPVERKHSPAKIFWYCFF